MVSADSSRTPGKPPREPRHRPSHPHQPAQTRLPAGAQPRPAPKTPAREGPAHERAVTDSTSTRKESMMRQSLNSVLPENGPERLDHHSRHRRRARPPLVERIAGWSARHKKIAVFGWLLMVAAIFVFSQMMGSRNLPTYAPGQAGQGERALHQVAPATYGSASESVLIQARPGARPLTRNPDLQQAARQVAAALDARPRDASHVSSPLTAGNGSLVSAYGRRALVRVQVAGPNGSRSHS